MNVPTELLDGYSEPSCCFVNVARAVRDYGGTAVLGWLVSDDVDHRTLIHHCVWRKPTGKLVDISPQFGTDPTAVEFPPTVEFVPDPSAALVEGRTRPNQYEAKHPKFERMVEFRIRSERAFFANDPAGVNYWAGRADKERYWAHGHRYDPGRPTILKYDHRDTLETYEPLSTELAKYLAPEWGRPFDGKRTY